MGVEVSPIERFYLAARSAAAGRRLRDPVLLLAAAKIAKGLGTLGAAAISVRIESSSSTFANSAADDDARPLVAALRSDARMMALGRGEEALIDLFDGQIADTPEDTASLMALRSTIGPASAMLFSVPAARSAVVAGDGRSPLRCTRDMLADMDASDSLSFLVSTDEPEGESLIRVENVGRYPVDVICVWRRE